MRSSRDKEKGTMETKEEASQLPQSAEQELGNVEAY